MQFSSPLTCEVACEGEYAEVPHIRPCETPSAYSKVLNSDLYRCRYRLPPRLAVCFHCETAQEARGRKAIGGGVFNAELEIVDRVARGLPETAVD